MRKSIDGLSVIVSENFKLNPFENALFLNNYEFIFR
ncbi:IS66 family insertion sequence element accessory protein TnpB [Schnuerera ultunensis]